MTWEFVVGTNPSVCEGCAKSEARNNARVAPIYMVGAPSRRYGHVNSYLKNQNKTFFNCIQSIENDA